MEDQHLLYLLNKYKNNTLSGPERQELEQWYASLDKEREGLSEHPADNPEKAAAMLAGFRGKYVKIVVSPAPVRTMRFTRKWARFAAFITGICLTGAVYFLFNKPKQEIVHVQKSVVKRDIAPPETNKAVLTLADGSKIALDSTGKGKLAVQGLVNIIKQADGQIAYTGNAGEALGYNTLTVPKGSKPMKLLLADGSRVWLNVASSVTYPVSFTGKYRKVLVTGEAYFEVTKNTSMPFFVTHNGMDIKVLGTHFNVNTYDDEKEMKVTLLEGSVMVSTGNQNNLLKPGQQAQVNNESIKILTAVDKQEVMAWKNGLFYFDGADIKTVMRQIEKWYNVEIHYRADIRYSFIARISREVSVSEILKLLQLTDMVHFNIEENKITVMK